MIWRATKDFFAELIRDAEDVYEKNEDSFRDRLGDVLTSEQFAAVRPLERPRVLARAQLQLEIRLASSEAQRLATVKAAEDMRTRALSAEARAKRAEKQERGLAAARARKARKEAKRGRSRRG